MCVLIDGRTDIISKRERPQNIFKLPGWPCVVFWYLSSAQKRLRKKKKQRERSGSIRALEASFPWNPACPNPLQKTRKLGESLLTKRQQSKISFYLVFDLLLEFSSPAFTMVFLSKTYITLTRIKQLIWKRIHREHIVFLEFSCLNKTPQLTVTNSKEKAQRKIWFNFFVG